MEYWSNGVMIRGVRHRTPNTQRRTLEAGSIIQHPESVYMQIKIDDLTGPEIGELLNEHLASMHLYSPPESIHALPIDELRKPEITFWSVWENGELLGCGALKELEPRHGEIKSMRTVSRHL